MDLLDMGLTLEAIVVAQYLSMRAREMRDGTFEAWPSHLAIGEACLRGSYPNLGAARLRLKVAEAIDELEACQVLVVNRSAGIKMPNHYQFQLRDCWRRRPDDYLESWLARKGQPDHPNIRKGRSLSTPKPQSESSGVSANKGDLSPDLGVDRHDDRPTIIMAAPKENNDDRPTITTEATSFRDDRPTIIDDRGDTGADDRPTIIGERGDLLDRPAIIDDRGTITIKDLNPLRDPDRSSVETLNTPYIPQGGLLCEGGGVGKALTQPEDYHQRLVDLEGMKTQAIERQLKCLDLWQKVWDWQRGLMKAAGQRNCSKKRAAIAWWEFEQAVDLKDDATLNAFRDRCRQTGKAWRDRPSSAVPFDQWLLGRTAGAGVAALTVSDWTDWIAPLYNQLAPDAWSRVDASDRGWTAARQKAWGDLFVRHDRDKGGLQEHLAIAFAGYKLHDFFSGRKVLEDGTTYRGTMDTLFRKNYTQERHEELVGMAQRQGLTATEMAAQVHSGEIQPVQPMHAAEEWLLERQGVEAPRPSFTPVGDPAIDAWLAETTVIAVAVEEVA